MNRRIAGQKAKRNGQDFETIFQIICEKFGVAITRIPDGCRQVSANKLIRTKTPFDWVLSFNGASAMIDTKSIAGKAFPFASIDFHQVREMQKHEGQKVRAGYIIWLRESGDIIFVPSSVLIKSVNTKGSFKGDSPGCVLVGSLHPGSMTGNLSVAKIFGVYNP